VLRLRRGGLLLALVVVAVLGSSRAALACSCSASGPACQAFWDTPVVFDAVVRSLDPDAFTAMLDVRHVWKGTVPARVVVPSSEGSSVACIYEFQPGKRYLVFARRNPRNGKLTVSLCSATTEWDGTGPDAEFLASLSRPAKGGTIVGIVEHFTRPGGGVPEKDTIPVVTAVHLQTPAGVRSVTSTGGIYRFDALAPGAYGLTIDTPDGYTVYSASRRVEIRSNRACSSEPFSFTDNGRIAGRLVGYKRDPAWSPHIEVVTAGNIAVPPGVFPRTAQVDDDGSFEAKELPAGDYVVGVNLGDIPNPNNPYARALYPQGGSGAGIVTVKAGERVDLGTWQLPGPAPSWVVSGTVEWEDGRPAGSIEVRALEAAAGRESAITVGRVVSAADGRFAMVLWQGHRYRFVATSTQMELMLVAVPVLELGDRPPSPLRIAIRAVK
jgi:hypothetical protein